MMEVNPETTMQEEEEAEQENWGTIQHQVMEEMEEMDSHMT